MAGGWCITGDSRKAGSSQSCIQAMQCGCTSVSKGAEWGLTMEIGWPDIHFRKTVLLTRKREDKPGHR